MSGMLNLADQNSKQLTDMLRAYMDKVESIQAQMYPVNRDGNSKNESKRNMSDQ